MTQYIIYSLDLKTLKIDIISIETNFSQATNLQNSYSFKLLCNLNKQQNNESLYRLTLKDSIIQIVEVAISYQKGWLTGTLTEQKQLIYEIGIIEYKSNVNLNLNINTEYFNKTVSSIPSSPPSIPSSITPPPIPQSFQSSTKPNPPSWDDVFSEIKKRRATIS